MTATMDDALVARQVEAGAILPGAGLGPAEDRDVMSARHYQHPGLPGRTVVRLVPGTLAPADDLTMSYLGFTEPVRTADVGVGRRRALGFPAWALINDPANAHHALNLVKELEPLARTAKSSPGAARDALLALAEQLGRSAPHFLPTFYEQAGRIYLETGSLTYAASMFGKAREAEAVHNLTVDPDRLRAVFLEFAFAGALTAKALSGYARSLTGKYTPDEAYDLFRTLCVERTRGGLAPYSGMPEDLRRLAKAAKRSLAEEDAALLRAVLDTPAVARAGAGFWKSYRGALVALARQDPAIRGQLLSFVPESTEVHGLWLELLAESGTTAGLIAGKDSPALDPAVLPPAGPAGWLNLMLRGRRRGWPYPPRSVALLDLVAAMAPRLREAAEPVHAFERWNNRDLDVLDLLLAEGIATNPLPERYSLDVSTWRQDTEPGRRELTAIAADPRLRPALATGLLASLRGANNGDGGPITPQALAAVRRVPGLRTALTEWSAEMAQRTGTAGFGAIEECLSSLTTIARPAAYADRPAVARQLAEVDLVGALTTALRGGLFDELGWPALEEGIKLLTGPNPPQPGQVNQVQVVGEGWPALVLAHGERMVVVGPDGVLLEHTARVPAELRSRWQFRLLARYVDGRLLVCWHGPEHPLAYWSDAPDRVFPVSGHLSFHSDPSASISLPGGGRFTGGRALHAGDQELPDSDEVLSDGVTHWSRNWTGTEWAWCEIDVATGEVGRRSIPGLLEDFAADGAHVHVADSGVRPVAPGTEHSPLGARNGLHGWRLRQERNHNWTGQRIDGEQITVPESTGKPLAAFRLPGSEKSRLVVGHGKLTLLDPDGVDLGYLNPTVFRPVLARGTALVPPLDWWHCLRPRDEAGSVALRAITRDQATALLAAAVAERDGSEPQQRAKLLPRLLGRKTPEDLPATLRRELPQVTHPELVAGLLGVLRYAARLQTGLAGYADLAEQAESLDPNPEPETAPEPDATEVAKALDWTRQVRTYYSSNRSDPSLVAVLGELAAAAAGQDRPEKLTGGESPTWLALMSALPALAYRAALEVTDDEQRTLLRFALDAVADSGVAGAAGHWRTARVEAAAPAPNRSWQNQLVVGTDTGFVVLVQHLFRYGQQNTHQWQVIQFTAKPGVFPLPKGWTLSDESPWSTISPEWTDAVRRALAGDERVPVRPEHADVLVERTGMSRGEAMLLLAGLPNVGLYEANFLTTEVRTALGLKAAEAKAARERLKGLDAEFCYRLLAAAVPADPSELWTTGPDLEALAACWLTRFDRRTPVPDELLTEAAAVLPHRDTSETLAALADPANCGWLHTDARMRLVDATISVTEPAGMVEGQLAEAAGALIWLAYRLPADSPLRAGLATAHELGAQRVRHPEFMISLGQAYDSKQLSNLLSLPELQPGEVHEVDGFLVVATGARTTSNLYLRPGRLRPEHLDRLRAVLESITYPNSTYLDAAGVFDDADVAAACARTAAVDGYFQHPGVSVPDLVTEVAQRHQLGEDAATLYLQLLALPDPTDANVARWTGWKPARLKKARAELAETDLVLTAKRARAGRTLFLPGGWLALKETLPVEEWKKPMYRFRDNIPVRPMVPREPIDALFRRAWQRVLDGNAPGYEELRTGRRR
jgi:hypothetical protein